MASILNLGEIKTEIRASLGGRTDLDSRLNIIVHLTQQRIARLYDFPELKVRLSQNCSFAGLESDRYVTIPLTGGIRFRKIYDVILDSGELGKSNKLEFILPNQWDKVRPEPNLLTRSWPRYYSWWTKTQIELYPLPDKVYELIFRMLKFPTSITAATADATTLDLENLDDAIISLATSYCFLSAGSPDKADKWFNIFRSQWKEIFGDIDALVDLNLAGMKNDLSIPPAYWLDPWQKGVPW